MTNPVLDAKRAERHEQITTMDHILGEVEGRDLTDAERSLLEASRGRIAQLDEQIKPLAEFEALRGAHDETLATLPQPAGRTTAPRRIDGPERASIYGSPGAFLVDYLRANGLIDRNAGRDEAAIARVYQARADQTTADTTGILPQPIVGQVVNLIDANRPLITSLGGAKPLGGIPGTTFTRPKITQHAQSGLQTAEKAALPSRKMTIGAVPFNKSTRGGTVDISRQDIDWTSPAAWDILIRDLADQYALDTEATVAVDFVTRATGIKPPALPAAPVLADWAHGLYTAAMHSYQAAQRMPARIWCSLDVWAALGSLVDVARNVMPTTGNLDTAAGSSSLADFRGDVLGLPRVVVPLAPPKTCIVGPADLYEFYEEVIGLLSVIEPSILGVQVAYGGYVAYGVLSGAAYVPLDLSAVTSLPTLAEADDIAAADAAADAPAPDAPTGGNGGSRRKPLTE
jgi:HK97 family phage major capsid protein